MVHSNFLLWTGLVGLLLLTLALASAFVRRLPISTSVIYFFLGCLVGPWGLDLLQLDMTVASPWLEHLTELGVTLSLFIGGLRLRLSPRHRAWRAAYRLASIVMLGSIAGVAWVAWQWLGLDAATALLLGAILAPTDPVLAGDVTVGHARERDRLRYALSGEAGLNDGAAFPFVLLGLSWLGSGSPGSLAAWWAIKNLLWAIPAGLALGFFLGRVVGRLAIVLSSRTRNTAAPNDFLALALIALSYTIAQASGAFGFLAVFAAGIGLRSAEIATVEESPHPDAHDPSLKAHPPAETLVAPNVVTAQELEEPAVAAGVLVAEVFSFGDTIERLLEVLLVVAVGLSLAHHWDPRAVWVSAALFLVIRPAATWISLLGTPTTPLQRGLIGWFGIRGIGSVYYLAYACTHGVGGSAAQTLADLSLSVVAISLIAHGITAQSLMSWYERRSKAADVK
ncbi:MAG TPA: sodium:proton antiporter [Steroidobacteraceae bacterium]